MYVCVCVKNGWLVWHDYLLCGAGIAAINNRISSAVSKRNAVRNIVGVIKREMSIQ